MAILKLQLIKIYLFLYVWYNFVYDHTKFQIRSLVSIIRIFGQFLQQLNAGLTISWWHSFVSFSLNLFFKPCINNLTINAIFYLRLDSDTKSEIDY